MTPQERKDYILNQDKYIKMYMLNPAKAVNKTFLQRMKDKLNAIKRTLFT